MSDFVGQADEAMKRIAFHDDRWVDAASIAISAFDPAITQAVTAVERIRIYQGRMFQVERHLERWSRTIEALAISGLPDTHALMQRLTETIQRNSDWRASHSECGVVMFASPGRLGRPTIVIDLYAIDQDLMARRRNQGTPLVITDVQQPSSECWSRNIKVRCRLHYYRADRQANEFHPDAIGILLDADGTVTESSVANLVIVEQGKMVSPEADQILDGVSLQLVRELAIENGLEWKAERITPERLCGADEILLTGSSCGIWFANSIDGSASRGPGPIYRVFRAVFDEQIRNSK